MVTRNRHCHSYSGILRYGSILLKRQYAVAKSGLLQIDYSKLREIFDLSLSNQSPFGRRTQISPLIFNNQIYP